MITSTSFFLLGYLLCLPVSCAQNETSAPRIDGLPGTIHRQQSSHQTRGQRQRQWGSIDLEQTEPEMETEVNGTEVLDHLVNLFYEQNRDAVKLASQQDGQTEIVKRSNGNMLAVITTSSPSAPFMQLITMNSAHPADSFKVPDNTLIVEAPEEDEELVYSNFRRGHSNSLVDQDLDDKHIKYDVIPVSKDDETRGRVSSLNENRLSNYKLVSEGLEPLEQSAEEKQTANLTTSIRRSEPSLDQIEQISNNSTTSDSTFPSTQPQELQRTGTIQARSMSASKTPLQRPPYATYDHLFNHQRSEQTTDLNKSAIKEVLVRPEEVPADNQSNSRKSAVSGKVSSNSSNPVQQLVESINKISSQLAHLDANRGSSSGSDQSSTNMDHQLQKLTPINQQIVELNPMPEGNTKHQISGLIESSRVNPSKDLTNRNHRDRYINNDRMALSFPDSTPVDASGSEQTNPQTGSTAGDSIGLEQSKPAHDSKKGTPDSKEYPLIQSNVPHQTLETLTSQLKHPHGPEMQRQEQQEFHDHNLITQESQLSNMAPYRVSSPAHYAASLINVTAPLILPLSASEAMQSSIEDPLKPSNGLSRTPSSPDMLLPSSKNQMNQMLSRGPFTDLTPLSSIYSEPANQFPLARPSWNQEAAISSELNSSQLALDRIRNLSSRQPTLYAGFNGIIASHHQPSHQASGFRSPHLSAASHPSTQSESYSSGIGAESTPSYISNTVAAPQLHNSFIPTDGSRPSSSNPATILQSSGHLSPARTPSSISTTTSPTSTKGFTISNLSPTNETVGTNQSFTSSSTNNPGLNRRVFNLTRVEHISAECSNDLIKTVIIFNGTFKGIIYSAGYVRDPNCMYVNGTGKNKYDFSIRLNQCGTLGKQENHPAGPNEIRRRDQVMWNTLSIQYNPIIEQEWDEHFRVSCEYGSDFWKTISFSPFNVETNTGSPVVFTVDPPQCQMEILRGHGMVGPRQETVSGPVTVGDPLTLLIHMRSEKAGYDILVKNCIAHNGGHHKMQLIDSNGCVVNERFISPFRGTYNDNDMKHVTLYAYLKAFRFTGSPVLYLECEIHMCQSSCPPQMCYWRRLSKRSAANYSMDSEIINYEQENMESHYSNEYNDPDSSISTTTVRSHPDSQSSSKNGRHSRKLTQQDGPINNNSRLGQMSDKLSLFQALEVRQERDTELDTSNQPGLLVSGAERNSLVCYRRAEVLAFLFTIASVLLVAISVTIGCCWRASVIRHQDRKKLIAIHNASISSANSISNPVSYNGMFRDNHNLNSSYRKLPNTTRSMSNHSTRHKDRLVLPSY